MQGITRRVFLVGNFAIKIASFKYGHYNFLQGCCANYSERKYFKEFNKSNYVGNMVEFVAPSFYCSLFGLIQIQARCQPRLQNITRKQRIFFKPLCGTDCKKENFGYYKNKLVCLDYAD